MSPRADALVPIHAGATVLCRCFRTPFECYASVYFQIADSPIFDLGFFGNPAFVTLTHLAVKTFLIG